MKHTCLMCLTLLSVSAVAAWANTGTEVLESTGVQGGVVVHVGCGDGELTGQLRLNERYVVQGLDVDKANVAKARQHLLAKGIYGNVSVDQFDGKNLPFVDNFVNLIVVTSEGNVSRDELMRVLAPRGVACVKDAHILNYCLHFPLSSLIPFCVLLISAFSM